jgi:hypothetical protein
VPQPTGPWSKSYNGFPQAIQLPPLSSPKDGPRYNCSSGERFHRVQHTPLRRRIPSTSHARRRLPAWAYPQVSCE